MTRVTIVNAGSIAPLAPAIYSSSNSAAGYQSLVTLEYELLRPGFVLWNLFYVYFALGKGQRRGLIHRSRVLKRDILPMRDKRSLAFLIPGSSLPYTKNTSSSTLLLSDSIQLCDDNGEGRFDFTHYCDAIFLRSYLV